ncbi:hypothetical protein BDR07DRAFT_1444309 [Suillus spraguei]|nr:hypothetical protein BDR07DRAFT_1444309 [Suillus spraguei]
MQINMRRKLCVSKNAGGQTVTSETALQLPLTYYGPSIPSGSDGAWTYGGLTSPAASTSSLTSSPTVTFSTFTPTSSYLHRLHHPISLHLHPLPPLQHQIIF